MFNKQMNYPTYNNNILYVIPQNKTNNTNNPMTTPTPENNNKRLRYQSSETLCKRRRVSPLTINTVSARNNYPVYVQQQQPIIVTNYYKPQPQVVCNQQQHQQQQQPIKQSKQSKQQKPIDASNQFKVTQVSEVFQGCSELSLPKLVIYLIYKIWCCCNLSQYQSLEVPMAFNNGYLSPKSAPITPVIKQYPSSNIPSMKYSLFSTPVNQARIPSPITPSSHNNDNITDIPNDKVNVLYKNICQSKIFQEQPVMRKRTIKNSSGECVITMDSDEEDGHFSYNKKETFVDPKDLETQILKACSRSCRGELKNNYSKLIDYVDHLLKITQISFSSVILALEYIYRLKEASQTPEGKFLNQWSYEEIIPVAFMMANKYVSDDRYSNTVWANVTNISLNHLNELEMKGLVAISFRLYVSESNYNNWINLIKKVSHDLSFKYEQLKKPTLTPTPTSAHFTPTLTQSKKLPIISCNLSPNPFTSTFCSNTSSSSSSSSHLTTPSSNLSTVIYSPMTPSKVQKKKISTSNLYMARPQTTNTQPPQQSHVIGILPPKPQQLLPTIPMNPRVFKGQSQPPTVITIPANCHLNVPTPYQGNNSNVVPKVQTSSNVVFFQKVNNTPSQPSVVRQNVCIYPTKKNNIYPSPPLSRTTSPNTDVFMYQNGKNTVVPHIVKNNQTSNQSIINPFNAFQQIN